MALFHQGTVCHQSWTPLKYVCGFFFRSLIWQREMIAIAYCLFPSLSLFYYICFSSSTLSLLTRRLYLYRARLQNDMLNKYPYIRSWCSKRLRGESVKSEGGRSHQFDFNEGWKLCFSAWKKTPKKRREREKEMCWLDFKIGYDARRSGTRPD